MRTRTNLFAFTPFDNPYPPYISLNAEDGRLVLTVRGPHEGATAERPYAMAGQVIEVEVPAGVVPDLVLGLMKFLLSRVTPP